MSLSATSSWGTEPTNPTTLATMNAFIKSQTISLSGTVGTSDIADGAVTSAKTKPGPHFYGTGALSTSTYVVTLNPTLAALVNGAEVAFKADADSPSGGCSASVDSLTAKPMYFTGGVAIPQGGIRANRLVLMRYNTSVNGGSGGWEVLSQSALPDDHYQSTSTTGTNDYVATFAPTIPALVDGTKCRFKVPNSNTGAGTFAPDGLTAKAIKKNFNQALSGAELVAGAIVELVYDGTNDWWQLVTPVSASVGAALVADARNLVIRYSTAARVTVAADEIIVKNSGGSAYVSLAPSFTIDISGNGANGLDTGGEASSTWYAIWCIYNPTTGVSAGLFSTSTTLGGLTLPSGYTYGGLIGYVYNSSGSNFTDFEQRGRRTWITSTSVHSGVGVASPTALSLATVVPPAAVEFYGLVGTTSTTLPIRASFYMTATGWANAVGAVPVTLATNGTTGPDGALCVATTFSIGLRTSQQIWWEVSSTSPTYGISGTGFTF